MAQALAAGRPFYAVPFVVDRLDLIDNHLGYEAGDKILEEFSQHLIDSLKPRAKVCRWTGTSLVALLDLTEPLEYVRAEMQSLAAKGIEHSMQHRGHAVRVPVAASCLVLSPLQCFGLEELVDQLDSFVANHLELDAEE